MAVPSELNKSNSLVLKNGSAGVVQYQQVQESDIVRFMSAQTERYERFANDTVRKIEDLKASNRGLANRIDVIDDELVVSQAAQKTLQTNLEDQKKQAEQFRKEAEEVKGLKTQVSNLQTVQGELQEAFKKQQIELENREASVKSLTRLNELKEQKTRLEHELEAVRNQIREAGNQAGICAIAIGGTAGFFMGGPVGAAALGAVSGWTAKAGAEAIDSPLVKELRLEEDRIFTELEKTKEELQKFS